MNCVPALTQHSLHFSMVVTLKDFATLKLAKTNSTDTISSFLVVLTNV